LSKLILHFVHTCSIQQYTGSVINTTLSKEWTIQTNGASVLQKHYLVFIPVFYPDLLPSVVHKPFSWHFPAAVL